jgi:hypothetical protein
MPTPENKSFARSDNSCFSPYLCLNINLITLSTGDFEVTAYMQEFLDEYKIFDMYDKWMFYNHRDVVEREAPWLLPVVRPLEILPPSPNEDAFGELFGVAA